MREETKVVLQDWLATAVLVADKFARPTLGNLLATEAGDEDRERLRQQLRRAEQRGLLQREGQAASLVCRLTALGRLAALGGRDPEERWGRKWDGRWRLVLFDLPARRQSLRVQFLRWLHWNRFGCLQDSVWIHPDSLTQLEPSLAEYRDDVESLTLMEAQAVAGYSNAALVRGAWDFDEINKRYAAYLEGFGRSAAFAIASGRATFARASGWLRSERTAWDHAAGIDPFLPQELLPADYLGARAWQARRPVVRAVLKALTAGKRSAGVADPRGS